MYSTNLKHPAFTNFGFVLIRHCSNTRDYTNDWLTQITWRLSCDVKISSLVDTDHMMNIMWHWNHKFVPLHGFSLSIMSIQFHKLIWLTLSWYGRLYAPISPVPLTGGGRSSRGVPGPFTGEFFIPSISPTKVCHSKGVFRMTNFIRLILLKKNTRISILNGLYIRKLSATFLKESTSDQFYLYAANTTNIGNMRLLSISSSIIKGFDKN